LKALLPTYKHRNVRTNLVTGVMLFCLVVSCNLVRADVPEGGLAQLVRSTRPAVVFVVVAMASGAQSGTGFVSSSDASTSTIITANHVIEGETHVDIIFDSDEHERYPARVIKRDHVRDVAVLAVDVGHRSTLLLDSARDIQEGASIIVIGYPLVTLEFRRLGGDALRPSVHSGIISAVRLNGEIVQFDAATYHGDSGAPIIDVSNGRVVALVHGVALDPSYAARGLEQALPGSSFGPSATTISAVLNGAGTSQSMIPNGSSTDTGSARIASGGKTAAVASASVGATSASYRLGYDVPHLSVTKGSVDQGNDIDQALVASVEDRLVAFLKGDNALYLVPVHLNAQSVTDSEHLSGYCDDNRLNALAAPVYAWHLTGGPRYNSFGGIVGYSGTATVKMDLIVVDCFGFPFFAGEKTKSENRYFAHRTPEREIVDMANNLLDELTQDFEAARSARSAAWSNLLKTGIQIDPKDHDFHSLVALRKKSKGFAVVAIVPGGPADKAGIRVQDVILKIDENDASFLSLAELVGKMNTSEYIVSIQRPEGTLNVTVHPMHYAEIAKLLQR
jgi:S1-C subfamily serine protease